MNKYLKEIEERYPLLFSDDNELRMIVSLLYSYCKELEDRLRVFEEVPDSLINFVSLPENDDTPQLEEDIDVVPLERIKFQPEEEVEPTKLHRKNKPANDWVMSLIKEYTDGSMSVSELNVLVDRRELTISELEFIMNYEALNGSQGES